MASRKRKKHSTRRKVKRSRKVDKGVDRISDLPDAVLEQILCRLPFKDAVKTSLLSKRWRNLWMYHTKVNLIEGQNRTIFMDLVKRLLHMRQSRTMERFHLSCAVLSDSDRISKWVDNAVSCGVRDMSLWLKDVWDERPFILPSSVFICESMQSLELNIGSLVAVPSHVCFSSLKSLDLHNVVFMGDDSLQRLFSGCPVLEELQLANCIWHNVDAVCISAPSLRNLSIMDYILCKGGDPNSSPNCRFLVSGRKLEEFSLYGNIRFDYCLVNLSSLTEASLELKSTRQEFFTDMTVEESLRLFMLLQGVSNVRSLILSNQFLEALSVSEELYITEMPVFPYLTRLEVTEWDVDIASDGLFALLQNSPCLETLEFVEGIKLETSYEDEEQIFDPVPSCFSKHLKTIIVDHFSGDGKQRAAIELLLKHATCLERIALDIFSFDLGGDPTNKLAVYEHLDALANGRCYPYTESNALDIFTSALGGIPTANLQEV